MGQPRRHGEGTQGDAEGPPSNLWRVDRELDSALFSWVACVLAAVLAFGVPLLAGWVTPAASPLVEEAQEEKAVQSRTRRVAIRPAYPAHVVPAVEVPEGGRRPVAECR